MPPDEPHHHRLLHPDQPRLQRLLDEFFERMEKEGEEQNVDPADIGVDEAMFIAILTRRDEEGEQREWPVMFATTQRRFAQLGIIRSALGRQEQETFYPDDEDDD